MAAKHTCHALGCSATVPPRLVMCARHWAIVPKSIQADIWRTYRPGQERDKQPSAAYMRVQRAAVRAVAAAESRPIPQWLTVDWDDRVIARLCEEVAP